MACQHSSPARNAAELDFDRSHYLKNGNVVRHWFQRAWQVHDAGLENCFEPFIFTWISLNAWGECVTGQEHDKDWVRSLAQNQTLNDRFVAHFNGPNGRDADATNTANAFRAYWPIPRIQVWRKHRGRRPETNTVHDRARFFSQNKIPCEPKCALRHFELDEEIPLDWEHFLPATYRMRCNLFHGEKSPYDPVDAEIVRASFRTLVGFMNDLRYFS